jgi:hypothetical protein
MSTDSKHAALWMRFILDRCEFPNRGALAAQFANAEITELFESGCYSFALAVDTTSGLPPISVRPQGYGLVFQADFHELSEPGESQPLEILLFASERGYLSYVEITCAGDGIPDMKNMNLETTPFRVFESDTLVRAQNHKTALTSNAQSLVASHEVWSDRNRYCTSDLSPPHDDFL